ncbi:MAG: hypothetical protein COB24_01995 [Hyphomicrobiales bacterium]|nr:MAG: hypothetical protein COB24_01995 [Hyphomicrobiales bacterium]
MIKNLNLRISKHITNNPETLVKLFLLGRRKHIGTRTMDAKTLAIGDYLQKLAEGAAMPTLA